MIGYRGFLVRRPTTGPQEPKSKAKPSALDRFLARVCRTCPVCRRARAKQRGAAYGFVKRVEGRICPFCRAYERVYGRKSHEPVSGGQQ